MTRSILFAASLLLAAPVPAEESAGTVTVTIAQFAFSPAQLTVKAGSKVIWHNQDETPHNVVANDKSFASPALDEGESFAVTFDKPGSYGYFCRLHPHMTGSVTVTP
jgi:plastocyanin